MMSILAAITLTFPGMVMGVGLVVLPIAAHLMRRRVSRRVVFPSVQLLAAVAAAQSSVFRLRRWWLLLLRCLAVVAIVLAFAQPIWFSAKADAVGGRDASVVILVDLSASARQQVAGVSAIHLMKAQAGGVLDALVPGEDLVNMVYATARPSAALPGLTANPEALRGEVMSFEPGYERADLAGALALAGRMLADRPGARRLVVVSDLQAGNWADVLDTLSKPSPLPAGTEVTVLEPGHRSAKNLALHGAWVSPRAPRVGRPTGLGVRVTNHSDSPQSSTVRLRVDGREKGSRSLTVEPRQTREVGFTAELGGPGDHRVVFTLPGDGFPADDRCYLVARAVGRVPVVVVSDDDTDAPGVGGYYLVRALTPYGDSRDRYEVRRVVSGELSRAKLDEAAAVFVEGTGAVSPGRILNLYHYMRAGGGVVYFLGDGEVSENLEVLDRLAPDGVLPWFPVALRDHTAGDEPWTIAWGDWGATLLRRFDEAGRDALAQIRVRRAWIGGEIDRRAHTLLRYTDGTPALVWRGVGAGRLVLMNVSPEATHSDLGKHGVFVALMQGLADEMNDAEKPSRENVVGRVVSFTPTVPVDPGGPTPVVLHPDGKTRVDAEFLLSDTGDIGGAGGARVFGPVRGAQGPALDSFRSGAGVVIDAPDAPGFYTVKQGDAVLGVAAVNLDPRESDLRRVGADELQSALSAGVVKAGVPNANSPAGLGAHGRAVWGWLVLVAMGLFGIEMGLQGYWQR